MVTVTGWGVVPIDTKWPYFKGVHLFQGPSFWGPPSVSFREHVAPFYGWIKFPFGFKKKKTVAMNKLQGKVGVAGKIWEPQTREVSVFKGSSIYHVFFAKFAMCSLESHAVRLRSYSQKSILALPPTRLFHLVKEIHITPTWRIIPVRKWLWTMVHKSPK